MPSSANREVHVTHCLVGALVVRVIGEPLTGFGSRRWLGYTVFAEGGSVYATVFRDRVLEHARRGRNSPGVLLGTVMAHELGHLLLGKSVHARYGLMSCPWTASQLDRAAAGLLLFSTDEAARMRGRSGSPAECGSWGHSSLPATMKRL